MKVIYDFSYDFYKASAKFEVNLNKFSTEDAKEFLEFFIWDYDKENNLIDEYLKKLAIKAIEFATIRDYNTYGVIQEFEESEGFPPLDGSQGITLLDVQRFEFDEDDLDLEKIES